MPKPIPLNRHFRDLSQEELDNPERIAEWADQGLGMGFYVSWDDLLNCPRVVFLAEAGSGKTTELQAKAAQLVDEGRAAFFVPIDSLDREPIEDILGVARKRFDEWKADGDMPGYFFLDAVDELKLTKGKLDRALRRFATSLDEHLRRARIIISCRPSDWRASFDLATFEKQLPIPDAASIAAAEVPAEEKFRAALCKGDSEGPAAKTKKEDNPAGEFANKVRAVAMLPLSSQQIKTFAESSGLADATAFLAEIDKQNAWTFARRPLDLSELIAVWRSTGRLGTRFEQHEANLSTRIQDDPDRPDHGVLSEEEVRAGAERLALGLSLTRTRIIRSPEYAVDGASIADRFLEPSEILPDWSEEKRQTLLRRALFDVATYGRVRFHHRSVQEYLTACRLRTLLKEGLPIRQLFRLLFARSYGEDVIIPSMQPVAAWLSLWSPEVRREVIRREPEILLQMGDPESLDLEVRADILRAFATRYGTGGTRGIDLPIDEIRRFAHPELGLVIRTLWPATKTNEDVRELFIKFIWLGALDSCADLAEELAFDASADEVARIFAVRALQACGKTEALRRIVEAMLSDGPNWPDRIVHSAAADILPDAMTCTELMTLVKRVAQPSDSTRGFAWSLRVPLSEIDPLSLKAKEIRNAFADAIVELPKMAKWDVYHLHSKRDYLAPMLAKLCTRQLAASSSAPEDALLRAAVVAHRFGTSGVDDEAKKLRVALRARPELRSRLFWTELEFVRQIAPSEDAWRQMYHVVHHGLVGQLLPEDVPWLLAGLAHRGDLRKREVALQAVLLLWRDGGRDGPLLTSIKSAVVDHTDLADQAEKGSLPPQPNPEYDRWQRHSEKRACLTKEKERRRLETWTEWRTKMLANPADAFTPEHVEHTIYYVHSWMRDARKSANHYEAWDGDALAEAFDSDFAAEAVKAFSAYWRRHTPVLWSERKPDERNSTPWTWIRGLTGVAAEATQPGWATRLTPDDAALATRYTTVELNGFGTFLGDLIAAHPTVVEKVLGDELTAQFAEAGKPGHLSLLQDVRYAPVALKELLAPRVVAMLSSVPKRIKKDQVDQWAHNLDYALGILTGIGLPQPQQVALAKLCADRFKASPRGPLALTWMKALLSFDAEEGATLLADTFAGAVTKAEQKRAVSVFAGLFGHRSGGIKIEDRTAYVKALGLLIRAAYRFVKPSEDPVHEGVHSVQARDEAGYGRGYLLSALIETPGPEARDELLRLAAEPEFAHFPDRLRRMARDRAAKDAEFAAYRPADVFTLDQRKRLMGRDRDGIYQLMMEKLDDLAHAIAHHDFTNRATLRTIKDETEMQRSLALQLDLMGKDVFEIVRENEVADGKKTDLRFSGGAGTARTVTEVKIGDMRWSLADLAHAVRHQLYQQYLRYDGCRAGCLLVTYDGTRTTWQHPETKKTLNMEEALAYLRDIAAAIEEETLYAVRIGVEFLDLRDPELVSAHR